MSRGKKLVIRIPKDERRPPPRAGVKASRVHKSAKAYSRKPKHPKREG
jgi:hypothetical protein